MTSDPHKNNSDDQEELYDGPSKSQIKRDCHHLVDLGEKILKLKAEEIRSLELPDTLEDIITKRFETTTAVYWQVTALTR